MVGGLLISAFYLLFVHTAEAGPMGLCKSVFGVDSLALLAERGSLFWKLQYVDPNIVAMPISFMLAIVVSLATSKLDQKHVDFCWKRF